MPWIIDENGERKYKPSMYTKEELPTWSEIYEEWFLGEKNLYDPRNPEHQELDPYWKIPRRLFLVATACNQMNKMIFEDGKDCLGFIRDNINPDALDVRFVCESEDEFITIVDPFDPIEKKRINEHNRKMEMMMQYFNVCQPIPPPIYSFFMPNGKANPFILPRNIYRKFFTNIEAPLFLYPIIMIDDQPYRQYMVDPFNDRFPEVVNDYKKIIDFMLSDMSSYFGGDTVGWKDANGNVIESNPAQKCPSGYDPAL